MVRQLLAAAAAPGAAGAEAAAAQAATEPNLFTWGGRLNRVPEDFDFPQLAAAAWQQYCCGVPAQRICPLRKLRPSDMSMPNKRKRLSDYKYLFGALQAVYTLRTCD